MKEGFRGVAGGALGMKAGRRALRRLGRRWRSGREAVRRAGGGVKEAGWRLRDRRMVAGKQERAPYRAAGQRRRARVGAPAGDGRQRERWRARERERERGRAGGGKEQGGGCLIERRGGSREHWPEPYLPMDGDFNSRRDGAERCRARGWRRSGSGDLPRTRSMANRGCRMAENCANRPPGRRC